MPLDLDDLISMSEFPLELSSVGRVTCTALTTKHLSKSNKRLLSTEVDSHDFARWLLGEVARKCAAIQSDEHKQGEGERLNTDELNLVTGDELEKFSEELLANNWYLRQSLAGEDLKREDSESASNFLVRAVRNYNAEEKARWEGIANPLSRLHLGAATLEALRLNHQISDQLGGEISKFELGSASRKLALDAQEYEESKPGAIAEKLSSMHQAGSLLRKMKQPDIERLATNAGIPFTPMSQIPLPHNPIHNTNEKLERIVDRIEHLGPVMSMAAQLIQSMNDTALKMQSDFIENARDSGRKTSIAIFIAAASLVLSFIGLPVSIYFSYQSLIADRESTASSSALNQELQGEIHSLIDTQRRELAILQEELLKVASAQSEEREALVNAILQRLPATTEAPQ